MHCSPWITIITLYATTASAFYPYELNKAEAPSSKTLQHKRFFPWPPPNDAAPIIPIPDTRKNPSLVKRDNRFPVVLADNTKSKNSLGINQDGADFSYFVTVNFGPKRKPLWMLVDTGAANTWVMGSDCTSEPCKGHDVYGKADSDTLRTTDEQWNVTYGTGVVSGIIARDTVSFADFEVEVEFGLATSASSDFNSYPFDGILGLGRQDEGVNGSQSIVQTLEEQKLLKSNVIGVNLARNKDGARDGQLTFGDIDKGKFTGELSYTSTKGQEGLWEIPAEGCGFGGKKTSLTDRTAVLDTGTSYILMPPDDAQALHEQFPTFTKTGETYQIPCDVSEPVQFTFSGVTYDVSPRDYVGPRVGDLCTSNIVGHQAFGPDTWLLGDVFMKNVYAVFDYDQHRIGLGVKPAAKTSAAPKATAAPAKTNEPSPTSTATTDKPETTPTDKPDRKDTKDTTDTKEGSESTTSAAAAEQTRPSDASQGGTALGVSGSTTLTVTTPFSILLVIMSLFATVLMQPLV